MTPKIRAIKKSTNTTGESSFLRHVFTVIATTMEQENDSQIPVPSFEMGKHHKNALKTLLFAYHNNRQTLTYPELSDRIGVGEKTKAWQCGAWRDLKSEGYIVPAAEKSKFQLSPEGVALATTLATPEELAEFKPPGTNEELHAKIKAKLARLPKGVKYASKMLDLMLAEDYLPLNRHELAAKFDVLADSHGFFYGLQALQKMKYVEYCTSTEIGQIERFRATLVPSNTKEENSGCVKQDNSGEDAVHDEKESSTKAPPKDCAKQENSDKEVVNDGNSRAKLPSSVKEEDDDALVKQESSDETHKGNSKRKRKSKASGTTSAKSCLPGGDKKQKMSKEAASSKKKKKQYKSTKKRSGGKLLKLAASAYVTPPPTGRWVYES